MARLGEKQPSHNSGYNLYVRAVTFAQSRALGSRDGGDFIAQQDVVKIAAQKWRHQDDADKTYWSECAVKERGERKREIATELDKLEEEIYVLKENEKQVLALFGGFRASSGCKFTSDAMQRMEALWKDPAHLPRQRVLRCLKHAFGPAMPLLPGERAAMGAFPQPQFGWSDLEDHTFAWTRLVCRRREYFHGVGLLVGPADGDQKMFLYSVSSLKPFEVMWTLLTPVVRNYSSRGEPSQLAHDLFGEHEYAWIFDPCVHYTESAVTPDVMVPIQVFPYVSIGRRRQVHTNVEPVAWDAWVGRFPPLPPQNRGGNQMSQSQILP